MNGLNAIRKYLIATDPDTGSLWVEEARIIQEPVSFGHHYLPYEFDCPEQGNAFIKANPGLIKKYRK